MRQSLGRYSSLADWGHGVFFIMQRSYEGGIFNWMRGGWCHQIPPLGPSSCNCSLVICSCIICTRRFRHCLAHQNSVLTYAKDIPHIVKNFEWLQAGVAIDDSILYNISNQRVTLLQAASLADVPLPWVPELSPASATRFWQQRLTITDPKQCSILIWGVCILLCVWYRMMWVLIRLRNVTIVG
jgi:hypothetical protein